MLQHEQTDPPAAAPTIPLPVPNAADARVTPDELNAALKALEDRQTSTVAIGSVVNELRLNATPEQIWEQVQQQRVEAAQKQPKAAVPMMPPKIGRHVRRGWREAKGWIWVLFWCSGGLGLISGGLHMVHHAAAPVAGIVISGDSVTGNYVVQGTGPQRDAVVSGEDDKITLRGDVRNLRVDGEDNTVTVIGSVEAVTVDNEGNSVHWTKQKPGKPVQPQVSGEDNKVGLSGP